MRSLDYSSYRVYRDICRLIGFNECSAHVETRCGIWTEIFQ